MGLTTSDELGDESKIIKLFLELSMHLHVYVHVQCTWLQDLKSGSPQQVIYDTSVDLPPLVPETSSLDTGVRSRWCAIIIMHN